MKAKTKGDKKKMDKVIDDKTFGLKNKNKSKAVQKYIKGVINTVKGVSIDKAMIDEQERSKLKKKAEEEAQLMASLFKTVNSVKKIGEGDVEKVDLDPKQKLCQFHKQGLCQKGKKCKYSHDLSLEQKSENINLYIDQRTQMGENNQDEEDETVADWTEEKLREVIQLQQVKYKSQKQSEIVCKFFLDAVEKSKYGWKWICPNGMNCHYRHCLPLGYVLKKNVVKIEESRERLEDLIDRQISDLKSGELQKVTLESFLEWKKKRKDRKEKEREQKRQDDIKKVVGRGKQNVMSGRALFAFDPTLFEDDEEVDDEQYEKESDAEVEIIEEEKYDIDEDEEEYTGVEEVKEDNVEAPKKEEEEQEQNQVSQKQKNDERSQFQPQQVIQKISNEQVKVYEQFDDNIMDQNQNDSNIKSGEQKVQDGEYKEDIGKLTAEDLLNDDQIKKKKKKKKKNKNSEDVQINDDVFLEEVE